MVDMRGMKFKRGDRVAVACRAGSFVWQEVRVVADLDDGIPIFIGNDGRKRKYLGTSRALVNLSTTDFFYQTAGDREGDNNG